MSANLTDVSAFTSPVVVPVDGDTESAASVIAGFQPLADRTRYLKDRLDLARYGRAAVSGSPTPGVKATLALSAASGVTLVANQLVVPQTGLYLITADVVATLVNFAAVAGDPAILELRINNALTQTRQAYSFDGTTARKTCLSFSGIFALNLNDTIDLRSAAVTTAIDEGTLSLTKVQY
jgi:hypothetical protein